MRVNKEVISTTFFCTTCDCRRDGFQTPDSFDLTEDGDIHRIYYLICNHCKNVYKITDTFELSYKHTKEELVDKESLSSNHRTFLHFK